MPKQDKYIVVMWIMYILKQTYIMKYNFDDTKFEILGISYWKLKN